MKPFFSIVIPSYNRPAMTMDAVDSVLRQNFTAFEVIIVDDGSTDNTQFLLKEKYRDNKQVKILYQQNSERGAARNNGLRTADGEYICFLDSDDVYYTNHLETLYNKITELNHPDFIATKFRFFRNGKFIPADIFRLKEGFYDYHLFLNGNPLACNICVRKANPSLHLFIEDRRYSVKEDWMFLLLNTRHNRFYLIDAVTMHMNDHDLRSMRTENKSIIDKTFLAGEYLIKHLQLPVKEEHQLKAHLYYLSAIHYYIDNHKKQVVHHIRKAISLTGMRKKYLILLCKVLAGPALIRLFKLIKH
jgi:glycosyltransferase involved in cell wall biosynthesis